LGYRWQPEIDTNTKSLIFEFELADLSGEEYIDEVAELVEWVFHELLSLRRCARP